MNQNIEIWIKGTNRTAEIASIEQKDDGRFLIVFKKKPQNSYSYDARNIRIVRRNGQEKDRWSALRSAFIRFSEEAEQLDSEASSQTDRASEPSTEDTEKAAASGGQATAWGLVCRNLNRIDRVPPESVLQDYAAGKTRALPPPSRTLIYPFGCNSSQKKAVENAFAKSLSVIQGPPGTGKTQTILNILANLLVLGKTAAVVSNNNAATKNVRDKLESDCGIGWLVAALGSKKNCTAFFADPPVVSLARLPKPDADTPASIPSEAELKQLSGAVDEFYANQLQLQALRNERHRLHFQRQIFLDDAAKRGVDLEDNEWFRFVQTMPNGRLSVFLSLVRQRAAGAARNIGAAARIWNSIRLFFCGVRGRSKRAKLDADIETVLDAVIAAKSARRLEDLDRRVDTLKDWLTEHQDAERAFIDASRRAFFAAVRAEFSDLDGKPAQSWDSRKYRESSDFCRRFPIVTSSTFALAQCAPNRGFDYLIMDEASQVNLPTAAVCFSLARCAVIVGDSKQLPAILPDVPFDAENGLTEAGFSPSEAAAFNAAKLSILDSASQRFGSDAPSALLREHYRCQPDIIEFCNRMFYDDELVVMTARSEGQKPFEWIRSERKISAGDGKARSHTNERQLRDIVDACRQLSGEGIPTERIGIITPYRDQADAVRRRVPNVEADTVHAYQGREKDVIIYSVVRDKPSPFLENPNLLNVAVSRAKSRFILISSAFEDYADSLSASLVRYICRLDPSLRRLTASKYRSVFDLLVSDELNQVSRKAGESPAEAIFRELLSKTLAQDQRFRNWTFVQEYPLRLLPSDLKSFSKEERSYMLNNARLDFLVFDRIDHLPIAAVEVDGASFHREGTRQEERDRMKDAILQTVGLMHARFRTDDAAGGEAARLQTLLTEAYSMRNAVRDRTVQRG